MSIRPQSAAPTSPSKKNRKSVVDDGSNNSRPKSAAKIARKDGQSYMAGAGIWGSNQEKREKIRPATASVHKARRVIKVRNTKHLKSAKPSFKSEGPAPLHVARDSFIYPSSRPSSSHSSNAGSRPGSAYNYGGFRRRRDESSHLRPLSSMSRASALSVGSSSGGGGGGSDNGKDGSEMLTEQRLRHPPWSRPPSRDAFSRNPQTSLSRPNSSLRPGSSSSTRSRARSANPGYTSRKSRPGSAMSTGTLLSEDYATTSWSRPSSRDAHSRGTMGGGGMGDYYQEEYEDDLEMDPFQTWQDRETVAVEYGYQSIGLTRRRPGSAASTSSRRELDSRESSGGGSRSTSAGGENRPHSPEPLVPHPTGGKLRPKSEQGRMLANIILPPSADQPDPWDVHLAATIPRPRNAISVVAPPTAPLRRPTTALQRGMKQGNTRPWSTDPTVLRRAKDNKAPALIHLKDGRPHTIGASREAEPHGGVVTYFQAFQLTGSHIEARRMMDTQHRMLGESRIRDYEHWESDKNDLLLQKKATRRWGTSGEFPMENPVTRSAARDREAKEMKELEELALSAWKSGKLDDIERTRERVKTASRKRTQKGGGGSKRPDSAAAPANIKVSDWGPQHDLVVPGGGGGSGGAGSLAAAAVVKRDPDAEAFHKSMMISYGTGEIEVLWQNLTRIPKSIMMSTLPLQCQHLMALRISGNKIADIPKWLFPNLHGLVELNVSNNKLTLLPDNIEVLQHLQKLTVSYNKITELPQTISNLRRLIMFDATGNCIKTLPPKIGNLRSLKLLRIGDNDLRFLSGGVENMVELEELILTRNRLGTLAMIQPLSVVKARQDQMWEKSRLPSGDIIYFNTTTTETLRRPPDGAVVIHAEGYESEEDVSATSSMVDKDKDEDLTEEELAWKRKVAKRAERLQLREDLSAEGKGMWEVKWTQFTGRAYYFNHFEKRKCDVMPRELDKLGQFPSIRRLVISFNVLQELPPSIGRLVKLEELIVDHNKLASLPVEIGGMQHLKYISMADNRLETLPASIGQLKRLHRINATYNHMKIIPIEIAKLTGLVQLWMSNNKLEELPVEMWTMTSLEELHLADNPMKRPHPDVIEKGIPFLLRELHEQWLRKNKYGQPPEVSTVGVGVRGEIIMPEPRYKKILEQNLRHAKETGSLEMQWKELHHVPVGAWDLTHLTELRLQNNFLKAASLTDRMRKFTALTVLSLSNNQLHEFPMVLLRVTSIEHLDLSNNYIPELPVKIDRMYRLKTVNLSQNRLTSIPKRFGKLVDITNINLDINHIGPTLPDSICNLWQLHTLKLVKNRLKTLPLNGLMNLTSLTLLNVNSNIIGPTLPEDISYMPNLADLRLSHNRLKTLPVAFCLNDMCTVLKNLWLYGNRIVQLPHEFRFLTSLTDLRIENNPMISPPPELSLQGPARILQYCGDRLERINELKRVLRDNHVRFNQDNLLPESKFVFTEGTDYLSEEDLAHFDQQIDRTLNGAYYNHMMDIQALTNFMREKKLERRIAHHKLLLEKFLIFLDIAIEKNRLNPKHFREDLIRPMGEVSKDEECYALLLEPLWEPIEGMNLPSVQRVIDEETAERRAKSVDTPPPTPGRPSVAYSIIEVTNDIFRTKNRPTFDYPLWQVREAAAEWQGPFGSVATFEHGLKFEDSQGYQQAQLDLEVVTEKIKRQKKGVKQARARVKEAVAKHAAESKTQENASQKLGEGEQVPLATLVDLPDTAVDEGIIRAFELLELQAKKLKANMALCTQQKHDDVLVILKIVYTHEEIRRERKEGYDIRVGEIEVRKEVDEWLLTPKHGKKALEKQVKEVKKFYKLQLKLVRDEIIKLIANRPKLEKDLNSMLKRKKAFDKGKKIELHRFSTVEECFEAVRMCKAPIEEMAEKETELREIEASRLALTLKGKKKEDKGIIQAEQTTALLNRYGKKEMKRIIEEARVEARDNNLRRPWDGPAGRAFRIWKEKAANLLEALLNPPSDTPSSESTDMSTDSEPEKDETSAASVERHKKWKKLHDEKLLAMKYKWGRLLTDDQIAKQKRKAEERRLAIFKYSKPSLQEEKEGKEEAAEEADDEESSDDSDEEENKENKEEENEAAPVAEQESSNGGAEKDGSTLPLVAGAGTAGEEKKEDVPKPGKVHVAEKHVEHDSGDEMT